MRGFILLNSLLSGSLLHSLWAIVHLPGKSRMCELGQASPWKAVGGCVEAAPDVQSVAEVLEVSCFLFTLSDHRRASNRRSNCPWAIV